MTSLALNYLPLPAVKGGLDMGRLMSVLPQLLLISLIASGATLSGRSDIEADVLEEVNFLRGKPAAYAGELDELGERFDGNILLSEGEGPDLRTHEGPSAVFEAARALRRTPSLAGLAHSDLLARAAADHVRVQGAGREIGHYSNGKGPGQRVKARGGNIYVGEVIVYGYTSPRNAVQQLVVDDGVPDRGHRKLLLMAGYRYAGVACGPHMGWRNMCVIVLAETKDGSPPMPPGGD